jgi:maltooligosyltrehalose trehalohydrolase
MMLGLPQLKAVAALTLLSPFVPLLFQGEEWGARTPFLYFTDHENADLGRLVADGRTKEFAAFQWRGIVPNPQDLDTFSRSKLNWSELSQPDHAELFAWYRRLIQLRSDKVLHPKESILHSAKALVNFNAQAEWLTFCHHGVLAVFNLRNEAQRVPLPSGDWELVLRSDSLEASSDSLPAQTTFIYIWG